MNMPVIGGAEGMGVQIVRTFLWERGCGGALFIGGTTRVGS